MGAWGEGMQANDTAQDAIFACEEDLVKGLTECIDSWLANERTWAILGVASEIVEKKLKMPALVKKKVIKAIKKELTKDFLDCWREPKARKAALNRFHKQLLGQRVSKKLLERDNQGLMSKIFEDLE
jgi:hypothetical protein